jgi:site-specific DNA recombinase
MHVVLYSRVSTSDQSERGVSLDSQEAKLRAFAQLHEFYVVDSIVDAGESAKSLDRPGLQCALGLLRNNEADGLIVAKLDRLTRSISDLQYLIDNYFCEKANKELFSVADSIDTRSAGGRLVLNMLSSLSQWERESVSERTREALRHKIASGQRCGKLRFGYDLADDGKMLVPNSRELAAIALMLSLRESGYSLRRIAAELTARQIPTKEGGTVWIHTAVGRILQRQRKVA